MKRNLFIILLALALSFVLLSGSAQAITVTATPNPVTVFQNINVNISQNAIDGMNCWLEINYGDSEFSSIVGQCLGFTCFLTDNHTYLTPGFYTIRVRRSLPCSSFPTSTPGTTNVTVQCSPLNIISPGSLPSGTAGQTYSYQILAIGGQVPITFSLISGGVPPGLTLSPTGLISGTPTIGGSYYFGVSTTDSCPLGAQNRSENFSLTIQCQPLNFTTPPTLASAAFGQTYSQQLQTSGGEGTVTYSHIAGTMPPGLTLSPSGLISGSLTGAGNFNFTVRATDTCPLGAQSTQRTFSVSVSTVAPPPPPPSCPALNITTSSPLSSGAVGQAYTERIQASGGEGAFTYSLTGGTTLPPGLNINSAGFISGTPAAVGNYSFMVKVRDTCNLGSQSVQKPFSIIITSPVPPPSSCPALNITTPPTLSSGTEGQVYSGQIQSSGGQTPFTYSLVSGTLPPGLNLSPAGSINGTPSASGSYSFRVRVTDSCVAGTQTSEQTFNLTINTAPPGGGGTLSVRVIPSSFKIPRGIASIKNITYIFTPSGSPVTARSRARHKATTLFTSDRGVFRANGTIIGEVNMPLTVAVVDNAATLMEAVNIPVSIKKRAENLNTTLITYSRIFTDGTVSATAQVNITLTTEATADFRITRLQLYFENRRAEITIKRNQPPPRAYAELRFAGSGLLKGHWEVDGRKLSNVFQHFVYGRTVILETPDIPPLPTFETGTHRLRFVLTQPVNSIPLPEIIYFITAEEYDVRRLPITLIAPENNAEAEYSPIAFSWQDGEGTNTYLIEFFEEEGGKPIFSAFTKKAMYKLPRSVLKNIFAPGQTYFWSVKGFDPDNNKRSESPVYSFSLSGLASYLPGQILMVTEDSQGGAQAEEAVINKYSLAVLQRFNIRALNMRTAVLHTDGDILKLIKSIKTEDGVIMAQPNHIFRTMSEPKSDMQNMHRVLNLSNIHKRFRGKGASIAVIDTGVDTKHKDLKDRITLSENLMKEHDYKAEIHGTAVAGVIGASINEFGITGVAPEADILALRACRQVSKTHPEGECYTSSITKALDTAIQKKADVINMSFGSANADKLLISLIDEGAKQGVILVAPVGNRKYQKDLTFPASHPAVIAVAGLDDRGGFYPNPALASKARACAPATNVLTTVPGDRHNFISGTSMASGALSGVFALAIAKDGSLDRANIPPLDKDICSWTEKLLNISFCE